MNNNLKILFITPAYWPAVSYGGPIQSVKLLAEELKKQNNYVEILTLAYGLDKNKFEVKEVDGIKVNYLKYLRFHRWFVPIGLLKFLIRNKNNFDIFHINLIWDPISWLSGFILALNNKKFIISPRGTIEEELIQKRSSLLKKILYDLLIKYIFHKTSGFHFTSNYEKEKFFEYTKIKNKSYVIIPNLFDVSEFQKKVDQNLLDKFNLKNKKYILYFGRINWKKRLELLIDAFCDFQKENKDFYLAIIGSRDENYFEKLKNKIKELNLEDKVILNGETITGDLKIALYQNAWCFVLPSISENFGYVVVEALACKVPVIVSENIGLNELLLKYNIDLIIKGENYEELKTSLLKQLYKLFDVKLKEDIKNKAEELILKEFNSENLTKKFLNFYLSRLK